MHTARLRSYQSAHPLIVLRLVSVQTVFRLDAASTKSAGAFEMKARIKVSQ